MFKDVTLPFCEYGVAHMLDSLLFYLLGEVDEKMLYSLYGISGGPFEYESIK